jgi:hypothetical protein
MANPLVVGLRSSVPSTVIAVLTVSSTLVPDPSTFTVWPDGMVVPDRVLEPTTSNPPPPAESANVALPATFTGLPDSVPPDWVKVPPFWSIEPATASVPAESVNVLELLRVYPPPLDTLKDPEFVVAVPESWLVLVAPMVTVPPDALVIDVRRYAMLLVPLVDKVPPDATSKAAVVPVIMANPFVVGFICRSPLLSIVLVELVATVKLTLVEDPSTMRVWVPVAPPPSSRVLMVALPVRSTEYVPAKPMQTTLELVGKPLLQFPALAFQLVVPVTGPCQLSVQVGSAPAGDDERTVAAPTDPNGANVMAAAAANLFHEIMSGTPLRKWAKPDRSKVAEPPIHTSRQKTLPREMEARAGC